MSALPDPRDHRRADHEIEPLFTRRWSPRAMNASPVAAADLNRLFEAARWAPSTYNEQEWRFLYAHREGPHWNTFFGLLMEANQMWCKNAGVLIVVVSHKVFERNKNPNPVHTFDSGLASENLLLQAATMGLVAHGMAGFDRARAKVQLVVPDDYQVEAMIAVGHPGDPADLPESLREREIPSGRKPIGEIALEGTFAF
jgi:nitroreductase